MRYTKHMTWIKKYNLRLLAMVLGIALLLKFLWPLWYFDVPLGYDSGIYRYLFSHYATAWPPFVMPDFAPWAREHPLGMFLFTSLFLKSGLPIDWLTGFLWNLFPVFLVGVLAWVWSKRKGSTFGILVLVMALLSQAYFDGFAAMYWKTFVALLFMVLAFWSLEQEQWIWGSLWSVLTLITHHQTGLLFGLVLGTKGIIELWKNPRRFSVLRFKFFILLALGLIVVLFYFPLIQDSVLRHIPTLLSGWNAPGGNFPPVEFYMRSGGILFLLGLVGFLLSWRKERFSLWQLSVIWSAIFVFFHLMFYRRFFLQLDFFLLPFAAWGFLALWGKRHAVLCGTLAALLLVQGVWSWQQMQLREPKISTEVFAAIKDIRDLPKNALVLSLENNTTPFLRGWLPEYRVGGPGLFDSSWNRDEWKKFLLGSHTERVDLLQSLDAPVFLFVVPEFLAHYKENGETFLQDVCFSKMEWQFIWKVKEDCLT